MSLKVSFTNQFFNSSVKFEFLSAKAFHLFRFPSLLDHLKGKVIQLLKQKDKGVRGALISFQDDNDMFALRNRIIHKVLTPTGSREDRHGNGLATSSSTNTAWLQLRPRCAKY